MMCQGTLHVVNFPLFMWTYGTNIFLFRYLNHQIHVLRFFSFII